MGAVNGSRWMYPHVLGLQDIHYLESVALRLQRSEDPVAGSSKVMLGRDAAALFRQLAEGIEVIDLPIGVRASVQPHSGIVGKSRTINVRAWELHTNEGQTLVIKRIEKRPRANDVVGAEVRTQELRLDHPGDSQPRARFAGVTLGVSNLMRARVFYCDALGLLPSKETPTLLQLGDRLAIRKREPDEVQVGGLTIYVGVADVERCRSQVMFVTGLPVSPTSEKSGRQAFACRDFDGHLLEVFQD